MRIVDSHKLLIKSLRELCDSLWPKLITIVQKHSILDVCWGPGYTCFVLCVLDKERITYIFGAAIVTVSYNLVMYKSIATSSYKFLTT